MVIILRIFINIASSKELQLLLCRLREEIALGALLKKVGPVNAKLFMTMMHDFSTYLS
jgi:hypothetical protein